MVDSIMDNTPFEVTFIGAATASILKEKPLMLNTHHSTS